MADYMLVTNSSFTACVGRLECADAQKTLYLTSGCEIIDTESDSYQEYSVFKKYYQAKRERYIYKPVGSVIIPGNTFTKVYLDKKLSAAIPYQEEPKAEDAKADSDKKPADETVKKEVEIKKEAEVKKEETVKSSQ